MMTLCKMISISCHTHSSRRIWCFYNQPMKDSSSASTWIPIPLPLCFETTNSSPEALSYINTAFCYCWFYLKKAHMHAHKHTANLFFSFFFKWAKNKHQAQMLRLNQCISPGSSVPSLPCDAAHCSVWHKHSSGGLPACLQGFGVLTCSESES